jgi:hypothetical protein
VTNNLDTLLTALYVFIDDHVVAERSGRGRQPELSDAELVTLAVAQVLLGYDSERRWIRHIHAEERWQKMFPYLPQQSGYHKRLKAAQGLLCQTILALATAAPSWFDDLWMTDATPVPCGASRETVKRSDLAGWANYGYCASHSRFYWGLKLYLICTGDGMPHMWCLADPKIGEREVVAALLDHNHHLIRTGQVLLADKGFSGREFKAITETMGIELLRPDRKDETYRNGNLGGVRQWIESVNDTVKGQLSLEDHGGRTAAGVFTRVAQRLCALAAGIWHNWTINTPAKRSLTAYDH